MKPPIHVAEMPNLSNIAPIQFIISKLKHAQSNSKDTSKFEVCSKSIKHLILLAVFPTSNKSDLLF